MSNENLLNCSYAQQSNMPSKETSISRKENITCFELEASHSLSKLPQNSELQVADNLLCPKISSNLSYMPENNPASTTREPWISSNDIDLIDADKEWQKTIGDVEQAWKSTVKGYENNHQNYVNNSGNQGCIPAITYGLHDFEETLKRDEAGLRKSHVHCREQRLDTAEIERSFLDSLINSDHIDVSDSDSDDAFEPNLTSDYRQYSSKCTVEDSDISFSKTSNSSKTEYKIDANYIFDLFWGYITLTKESNSTCQNAISNKGKKYSERSTDKLGPLKQNGPNTTQIIRSAPSSELGKSHSSPVGLISCIEFNSYLSKKSRYGISKCIATNEEDNNMKYSRCNKSYNGKPITGGNASNHISVEVKSLPYKRKDVLSRMYPYKNFGSDKSKCEPKFVFCPPSSSHSKNFEPVEKVQQSINNFTQLEDKITKKACIRDCHKNFNSSKYGKDFGDPGIKRIPTMIFKANNSTGNSTRGRVKNYLSEAESNSACNARFQQAAIPDFNKKGKKTLYQKKGNETKEKKCGTISVNKISTEYGPVLQKIKRAYIASDTSFSDPEI